MVDTTGPTFQPTNFRGASEMATRKSSKRNSKRKNNRGGRK